MWKRYPDQYQARTNLIGFFDELIAIVDEDGNGEIAVEEFLSALHAKLILDYKRR